MWILFLTHLQQHPGTQRRHIIDLVHGNTASQPLAASDGALSASVLHHAEAHPEALQEAWANTLDARPVYHVIHIDGEHATVRGLGGEWS